MNTRVGNGAFVDSLCPGVKLVRNYFNYFGSVEAALVYPTCWGALHILYPTAESSGDSPSSPLSPPLLSLVTWAQVKPGLADFVLFILFLSLPSLWLLPGNTLL